MCYTELKDKGEFLMEIKALMIFESTFKVTQTNPQGEVREIDAFISPTTNFIVPYIPWPLNITLLVLAAGMVGKQNFQLTLSKPSATNNLAKIEGEVNINSAGIVPEKFLSVSLPFTLNQIVFKDEGEYVIKIKLGHLAWKELNFQVFLHKENQSGS